jgi:hypothetical protein
MHAFNLWASSQILKNKYVNVGGQSELIIVYSYVYIGVLDKTSSLEVENIIQTVTVFMHTFNTFSFSYPSSYFTVFKK